MAWQVYDATGALKTTVSSLSASGLTGQVSTTHGGTGQDFSASTGFIALNSGTASIATLPKRATMWHDAALVTVGNALARTNNASQNYAHYVFQSTAANGDTFTHGCWLKAGTYTMSMLGVTATSAGIIDWYIDTVIIAALTGQDWYVASPAFNVIKTGSVTVVGDGYHVIKGVVNSKNASSSAYNIFLTKYWLAQASD